jgi:HPt (histidine-containing phosphotransfer) domain-containing protein
MTDLPILDRNHLNAMTGNDPELAMEVLEIFRHQAEIWSRLLDPRAEARQWADAAHTLKGASLGVGALALARACERAESAGRAETPPSLAGAAVLLSDVKDALGDALEASSRAIYDLTTTAARRAS